MNEESINGINGRGLPPSRRVARCEEFDDRVLLVVERRACCKQDLTVETRG